MVFNLERIKNNARSFYKQNMGSSIGVQLLYIAVSAASAFVLTIVFFILFSVIAVVTSIGNAENSVTLVMDGVLILIFSILYLILALGIFTLFMGVSNWYRVSIYNQTSVWDIFRIFAKDRIKGSFGVTFLVMLYTSLWGMLFVIPGIIKYYSYSQAMFIKAENPDIPASRAIELSKMMMDGHKTDLFCLQISFIGWFILSAFTQNILGIAYVFPYYFSAMAFAYEEIKADAVSRGIVTGDEISGYNYFSGNM